ncbi:hypothetical protein ARMSODRAFT_980571 [Armillaria solidipes]|uniref:Uncharacterized protein n=1 Tax=Armillaria solidipes TaxID=1076256 RepID=A0A2H3BF94_9AGAR|nr:hypothetical protein ARMSODRAFT_980571 [Armillaria solidipes]
MSGGFQMISWKEPWRKESRASINQSCEENEDSGCMRTFGRPWQRQGNSWYYAHIPKPLLRENFAWLCNVMVRSKLRRDLRQVLQVKIVFSPMRWVATLQGRSSSYMTVASANIGMQFYTNATQEPWASAGFLFEWQQRMIVEGGMDPLAARKHFLGGPEDEFQDVEGHRNGDAIFTATSVFLSLTIYSGNSTLRGSPEAGPNTAELNLFSGLEFTNHESILKHWDYVGPRLSSEARCRLNMLLCAVTLATVQCARMMYEPEKNVRSKTRTYYLQYFIRFISFP